MTPEPTATDIRTAINMLSDDTAELRLEALKHICLRHGGPWDVPENPEKYNPAFFEVTLHGVTAISSIAADLPAQWCEQAKRVLKTMEETQAA